MSALRIIERCSKTEDRDHHLQNLKSKHQQRNYPDKLIDEQFSQARKKTRNELIHQNRKRARGEEKKVRLIFTHNKGNPPLVDFFIFIKL